MKLRGRPPIRRTLHIPASPPPPRPVKHYMVAQAYGRLPAPYIGLCGVPSFIMRRVEAFESSREWDGALVVQFIERFARACRAAWPEWLAGQEPQFYVYCLVR